MEESEPQKVGQYKYQLKFYNDVGRSNQFNRPITPKRMTSSWGDYSSIRVDLSTMRSVDRGISITSCSISCSSRYWFPAQITLFTDCVNESSQSILHRGAEAQKSGDNICKWLTAKKESFLFVLHETINGRVMPRLEVSRVFATLLDHLLQLSRPMMKHSWQSVQVVDKPLTRVPCHACPALRTSWTAPSCCVWCPEKRIVVVVMMINNKQLK